MINDRLDTALQDAELPVSWRGRTGSFVSLMAVYESNFQRLSALAGGVRQGWVERRSRVAGDCELVLRIVEQAPYTTELELTYQFFKDTSGFKDTSDASEPAPSALPSAPDMLIRVYHDARLAEAHGWATRHQHPWLVQLRQLSTATLDQRWARNIMLNKWLEYCLERGHRLAADALAQGGAFSVGSSLPAPHSRSPSRRSGSG